MLFSLENSCSAFCIMTFLWQTTFAFEMGFLPVYTDYFLFFIYELKMFWWLGAVLA